MACTLAVDRSISVVTGKGTEAPSSDDVADRFAMQDGAHRELIARAQRGDHEAFEQLALEYQPMLAREARKLVPASDVDDVVQEAILRWYKAFPAYQEEGKLGAWLRQIVSRAVIDFWRSTRRSERRVKALKVEIGERTSTSARDVPLKVDLERFMETLSEDERALCVMAFLEELPHQEIAEILGTSWVAIKVRCFRLKAKIRRSFNYEQ